MILLHPADNVVVCCRTVRMGERILLEGGVELIARGDIEIGHKMARVALATFAKVIKYGAPIGSMTQSADAGEWVHLHNMKSDYIGAHTRSTSGEGE
ncbi:MAG TPA: UxaA family hydrolase [Steroidobacteraceae bacterium]|nr:UxaA family hydrolase [Steroidobacteraceae bacterium]